MRVVLHKHFQKRLQKLPRSIQRAYKIRRNLFLKDPLNPMLENHPLQGKYNGFRSISITGDFRVLYDPVNHELAHFILIGTHSELYG